MMCEDAANNKQQTHHCGGYKAVEEISRQGRVFGGQTEEISERSRLGDGPGDQEGEQRGGDEHHWEGSCKSTDRDEFMSWSSVGLSTLNVNSLHFFSEIFLSKLHVNSYRIQFLKNSGQ